MSRSLLFKDNVTRELFKAGESFWAANNFADAATCLVACLERARVLEQTRMFGSLIGWKREIASLSEAAQDGKLEPIRDFLTSLHDDVEILKLRLDYKAYMKYRDIASNTLSPWADWEPFMVDSSQQVFENSKKLLAMDSRLPDTDYLKSDWLPFAFPFVENAILTWQSIERVGWVELLLDAFAKFGKEKTAG